MCIIHIYIYIYIHRLTSIRNLKFISVLARAKAENETKEKMCICYNNASYIISYLLLIIIKMKTNKQTIFIDKEIDCFMLFVVSRFIR